MDNVLAVAIFIPMIQDIAKTGMDVTSIWWGILFGGTLFGKPLQGMKDHGLMEGTGEECDSV